MLFREGCSTLPATLQRAASSRDGHKDLSFVDRHEQDLKMSWAEVLHLSRVWAENLYAQGIRSGDRVVIVLPTGPAFLGAFFGAQWLGAIPAPLYPPIRLGRLDHWYEKTARCMARIDATLIVTDRRIDPFFAPVFKRYQPPRGSLLVEKIDLLLPLTQPDASSADQLGLIQFSSGTTQDPKPVALRHRQILSNVAAILEQIEDFDPERSAGEEHTLVSWLPLYHDMGLIGALCSAVVAAGRIYLLRPEDFLSRPALWLRTLARTHATVTIAPNFAYSLCIDRVRDEDLVDCDLSSLVYALNGAEYIAPQTLQKFNQRFAAWGLREEAFLPVYGLSEASLAVCFARRRGPGNWVRSFDAAALARGRVVPTDAHHLQTDPSSQSGAATQVAKLVVSHQELVSCGRPLRGIELAILDPSGQPTATGLVGAIHIRGTSVMDAYYSGAELEPRQNWLDTGDLGFLFEGELYISGRAKDMVILRGANFAPQDFELALDDIPGVRKGCSVAVGQRAAGGEELWLFVETYETEAAARQVLSKACRQAISSRFHLEVGHIELLVPGTLPRTSSGKLQRGATLALWQQQNLKPAKNMHAARIVGELVKNKVLRWQNQMSRSR